MLWLLSNLVSASPLNMSNYPKFPDIGTTQNWGADWRKYDDKTGATLRSFHSQLDEMRAAEQELKESCLNDRQIRKMTTTIKGKQVLIWPERFKDCMNYKKLLDEGTFATDKVILPYLNQKFSANYPPPRGDPNLVAQWNSIANSMVHFGGGGCDGASRSIVLFGTPGFSATPKDVFKDNKNLCPPQWRELFSEYAVEKKVDKGKCVKGWRPSLENGPDWEESCNSDIDADFDRADKKSKKLEDELAEIEKGNYRQSEKDREATKHSEDIARAQGALPGRKGGLAAAMRESIASQEEDLRKQEIFGGERGRAIEDAVRAVERSKGGTKWIGGGSALPGIPDKCDDAAYSQAAMAYAQRRQSEIQSLPLQQQQCELAKMMEKALQTDLSYFQRCPNHQSAIPETRAALADTEKQIPSLCGSSR
ncbi:hypothetical protein [Parazoarcus communis]|nr:hypothetical protein [Parazoarcus communis]